MEERYTISCIFHATYISMETSIDPVLLPKKASLKRLNFQFPRTSEVLAASADYSANTPVNILKFVGAYKRLRHMVQVSKHEIVQSIKMGVSNG